MEWLKLLNRDRLFNKRKRREQYKEIIAHDNMHPFLRDYYTIISSSHFRRLQDKTQVFSMEKNDSVRNRLTHSVEVSTIGEILGKKLAYKLKRNQHTKPDIDEYENNGDGYVFSEDLSMVIRCAGLLHDIGNPPFGHSGEGYIREWFKTLFDNNKKPANEGIFDCLTEQMKNDLLKFEGNAQGLRIATTLGSTSFHEIRDYGMLLTSGVLSSIVKYPCDSVNAPEGQKIGYYHSEDWIYEMLSQDTGTQNTKNPVMLLMEAADDLAYATADIEDFIYLDLIEFDILKDFLKENGYKIKSKDDDSEIRNSLLIVRNNCIEEVIIAFIENYDSIMDGTFNRELVEFCSVDFSIIDKERKRIYALRDTINSNIYHAKTDIFCIMDRLFDCLIEMNRNGNEKEADELLKKEIEQYYKKGNDEVQHIIQYYKLNESDPKAVAEKMYHNLLTISDFVSGMTDHYVSEFVQKITDIDTGWIQRLR